MRLKRCSPDPTLPRSGETRAMFGEIWAMHGIVGSHEVCRHRYVRIDTTQEYNRNNVICNILITIVIDKTNYRRMAQLYHIVAQLSLCGRVGP